MVTTSYIVSNTWNVVSYQDMETTQVSIDRGMDEENMVYTDNKILYSLKKKKILIFVTIWMKLYDIMLSEIMTDDA